MTLGATNDFTLADGFTLGGAGQSGDISVTAGGNAQVEKITTAGDVSVTATSGNITRTSDDSLITGAAVDLAAGGSIGSAAAPILTNVSTINSSSTGAGDIFITESDGATLNNITTDNGSVQISSTTGDLSVNTIGAGTDSVTLTATAGAITDDSVQTTEITAGRLTLTAPNGIGGAGNADIDTGATILNATSSGNIFVTSSGSMTLEAVSGAAVNLKTTSGSILDGNLALNNITATAASTLTAASTIGTFANPLEVNVTGGSLSVAASGSTDFFSVVISGTVPGNALSIDAGVPGYVWFNGDIVGGQLKTQVITEITSVMSEVTNAANASAISSLSPMLASNVVRPDFFALAKAEIDVEPVVRALASAKEFGVGPITLAAARPAVATPELAAAVAPEEKRPEVILVAPAPEKVLPLNLGNIRPLPVNNVQTEAAKPFAVPGVVQLDLQAPTMIMPSIPLGVGNVPAAEILPGRANPPLDEMLRQLLPTVEVPQGQFLPLLSDRGLTYIQGGNATAAAGQPLDLNIERILEQIREDREE